MGARKLMYLDGEARDRMIRFLRRRMDDWNISMDDLKRSLSADKAPAGAGMDPIFDDNVTQYQDVFGNSWDGQGEQPVWIKRALSLGLNLDHFRVRH
jgi:DNA-binding protein H-NS